MKVSYDWLQSFFEKKPQGGKLPGPAKLADWLTMYSFETELIEKIGRDYLLDVDILPNRAHDCLSHIGVAKEIAALLKIPLASVDYAKKIKEDKTEPAARLVKVQVKESELCPRYTARAIVDVKVGLSPDWLAKRLKVCGLRPINNIVDIANYAMLETGQPLHAFDADKLVASGAEQKTIIVRRAKKREKITTLDEGKYDLDENILVIADEKDPVCIAGIKGGKNPGVEAKTTRVILEAANFSPQFTRQASRRLKLKTDASWRFENELDPNLTEKGIDLAAYLIQSIAGGRVLTGRVDVYPVKRKPQKIRLDLNKVRSLLGAALSSKEIADILKRLSFGVKPFKKSALEITVPTERLDVNIPEDLVEEIGRVYGLAKIPSQLPLVALIPPRLSEDVVYRNQVSDILTHLGFSEVYNYSFVSDGGSAELLNPLNQEQRYLRPNLAANLLKNIDNNKRYFKEIALFEIGRVFKREKDGVMERKKLGAAIWPVDFYRLKGVIEALLNKLRISDIWFDDAFEEKEDGLKKAEVKVGNDLLGWVGAGVFELDFEKLAELATEERIYLPPSKYPAMIRDISVLVEPGTKVGEALNLIDAAGGPLVRDVDLFDLYEGDKVADGKKSFAFHIIFQSDDRTLTDKEVNKLQDKIIKALEEEGGWEVRKGDS